jgi:hypothetical protein
MGTKNYQGKDTNDKKGDGSHKNGRHRLDGSATHVLENSVFLRHTVLNPKF